MSDVVLKFVSGAVVADSALGARQIRVIASDPTVDRVKDIMVPKGCVLDDYVRNNIVLADHDPRAPIGNADIEISPARVTALITFAPKGISAKADEYCGLYKAGVLRAVSVGFAPIEWEPIKDGGVRYTKWALMELSGVAVPANPNAVTIERSHSSARRSRAEAISWQQPLTAHDRKEFAIRQQIKAQGLAELTFDERKDYLGTEFPGLSLYDALTAHRERLESISQHDRFLERVHQSDYAKEHRRLEALSPDQQAEQRRRDVIARTLPLAPFKWNPRLSDAHNMRAMRESENERQRRDYGFGGGAG